MATEKELNAMPAAPKAAKDIFQLCRGFERAFSTTIDVSIWLTGFLLSQALLPTLEARLELKGCTHLLCTGAWPAELICQPQASCRQTCAAALRCSL